MNGTSATSALLTDLYQLTMAQGYFCRELECRLKDAESQSSNTQHPQLQGCFHVIFRDYPFDGGYAIACGLAQVVEYVQNFHFSEEQIAYLKSVKASNGDQLFAEDFLQYLSNLKLSVNIDAVPEGTIVFPHEPILRITGPMLECQLIETPLLNAINFQTLVATKASRICRAAQCPVSEFGLRRAQGPEGGTWAARAACIGGCASTSNVEAGHKFGLPVSGTHSHSWVQSFDSEIEAFRAYAKVFPHNCILLVDTYNIEQGIRNAIKVGLEMRERGEHLQAIRIDSGDLSWLSKNARRMLDEAGLTDTGIVLSNDLDEYSIRSIRAEGGSFSGLGVGTKLATAYDQPALGGVYKLSAICSAQAGSGESAIRSAQASSGESAIRSAQVSCSESAIRSSERWIPKIKISETSAKTTVPGVLNVRRYIAENGKLAGDMIYDINEGIDEFETIVDPFDNLRRKELGSYSGEQHNTHIDLLQPLARDGKIVDEKEREIGGANFSEYYNYEVARQRAIDGLAQLDDTQKRTLNPHTYPVGLEHSLNARRNKMVAEMRGIHADL